MSSVTPDGNPTPDTISHSGDSGSRPMNVRSLSYAKRQTSTSLEQEKDSLEEKKAHPSDKLDDASGEVEHVENPDGDLVVEVLPEWWLSKYLPGYSPKRMLKFKNPKSYYLAINLLAGLAILFYGYDQGVMSQVNLNDDYLKRMGIYPSSTPRNSAALGGIVSVYYGGSLIGALFGGHIADRAGRITAIIIGVVISIIGAAFQTSAMNITWMCCARVVTGLGVGCIDAVIPVWSSEVSEHQARGSFLAIEFFLNIFGLALAYWIEIFTSMSSDQVMAWRAPIGLQIVFLLAILILVPFFPESPRYLAKVGRIDEARAVLEATRSGSVDAELRLIVQSVRDDASRESDNSYWRMLFPKSVKQKELHRRVVLSVWLQIMQELVGIGVITVYAIDLIQQAGFSQSDAKLLAGYNNISYMFCVLFAVFTLDRAGRRSTMVWGAAAMAVFLLLGGILDKFAQETLNRHYGGAVVALTFLYTGTFGATWLVTPWLYPTELFPTFVRAKGGAWSVVGWSIGNGVVTMITPFLFQSIGWGVMILLFALNLFVIPFIVFMYPETSGRPLEQIDEYFANSNTYNVFKGSKQLKEAGFADWRWTKRYAGGRAAIAEEMGGGLGEKTVLGKLRRKASNAGLI
ncbi:hypothetical protein CONPUDRAFT_135963 [Coniophora puteana RWD-64-598 SS2]|uniref:Major facilitator superfamily (MFS) profile domain-containing protein n=1 Tax=Coniophora puteana (strain RWD-64-598) TaxID=741705 RepID=A0A5M3MTY9_CONPW|nr:uncharacterized protein CONPUDRAFT_135963 [Coniophora puteana RWD-64-598 SS2]EIW82622.1 hypothetical protein CONPUDRAFT_135963 [Coniophora puteana RWD-64-598 SS2]